MKYAEMEPKLKESLYRILKERTAIFLDFIDIIMKNPKIEVAMIATLEGIKSRGKGQFMECQNEILATIKCIHETGEAPRGIDKRAANQSYAGSGDRTPTD